MSRCGIYPSGHAPPSFSCPLVKSACHYSVVDVNVYAKLAQTFVSDAPGAHDVVYVFPLPAGAAVCAFSAVIAGVRTIHGVVKQRDEAKREYDAAVAAGKTAGLLDQHTEEVFQVSLGNLKQRQSIEVNISFVSVIAHDGTLDSLRLTVPTAIAPNYGTPPATLAQLSKLIRPGGPTVSLQMGGHPSTVLASSPPMAREARPFELSMSFHMAANITSIVSLSHPISMTLGSLSADDAGENFNPAHAHVGLSSDGFLSTDIVLVLKAGKLDHPRCVVERLDAAGAEDEVTDALALTLVPRFTLPPLPAQEYIFLIDRSGSMRGGRIAAVRAALQIMLRSLPTQGTTFTLVSFGSRCDALWPTPQLYGADTLDLAAQHVDGMEANYGGTEIRAALMRAFEARSRMVPTSVFLLTDGEAWDVDAVFQTVATATKESTHLLRVFVLGVGDQVSKSMCEGVARAGKGVAAYVQENEKPDAKLVGLLKAARSGVIENVTVDWGVEPADAPEDDFEVVEAEEKEVDAPAAPPAQSAPISLFDTSAAPADAPPVSGVGPETIEAALLALPPPARIQQAPAPDTLPPLYPGFRTSIFAIVRQRAGARTPARIAVRGTLGGAPVALDVAVTPAAALAGNMVHVLAARALVQALEDAPGNRTARSRAQIVRLATRYGLASSQTSFVAVDDDGAVQPVQEKAPEPVPPAPTGFGFSAHSAGGGAGYKSAYVPPAARMGASQVMRKTEMASRSLAQPTGMAFGSSAQAGAQLFGRRMSSEAPTRSSFGQPAAGGGGLFGNFGSAPAAPPPPPGAPANMLFGQPAQAAPRPATQPRTLFGSAPPLAQAAPAGGLFGAAAAPPPPTGTLFGAAAPPPKASKIRAMFGDAPPPPEMERGRAAPVPPPMAAFGAPAPSATPFASESGTRGVPLDKLQALSMDARRSWEFDSERKSPAPVGATSVADLARRQAFDGSFPGTPEFFAALGLHAPPAPPAELAQAQTDEARRAAVWATVVALAFLHARFASGEERDAWLLMGDKAHDYVLLALDGVLSDLEPRLEQWIEQAKKLF